MLTRRVTDWDDAYANGIHIAGGERWPQLWADAATAFRERMAGRSRLDLAYGERPRNRLDLFLPAARPAGLVVFVHGGYWRALDRSYFSHLAEGAVESGHAVAVPSYTLCPGTRIAGITEEIGKAIAFAAAEVAGPIRLAGHSAGGHLAARMISATSPLPEAVRSRVVNTMSISGLHDLRPVMRTAMNDVLRIDATEALSESPALLEPMTGARIVCWVGGAERSEFIRQSALLANVWTGLSAETAFVSEPDRNHFTILDGLADARHALTRALLTA